MCPLGMNMQWDHLVNAFEGHRYQAAGAADARENRHLIFVREFASVVSLLQVRENALTSLPIVSAHLSPGQSCRPCRDLLRHLVHCGGDD